MAITLTHQLLVKWGCYAKQYSLLHLRLAVVVVPRVRDSRLWPEQLLADRLHLFFGQQTRSKAVSRKPCSLAAILTCRSPVTSWIRRWIGTIGTLLMVRHPLFFGKVRPSVKLFVVHKSDRPYISP